MRLLRCFTLALLTLTLWSGLGGPATAADGRLAYRLTDRWPAGSWPADALGSPAGLAASAGGQVYMADIYANHVAMMNPDGQWTGAFGNVGDGPSRLGSPRRVTVDDRNGRVYVADVDSYRLLVYDLAGNYLTAWPNLYVAGLMVADDGLLWLTDRLSSQVRAYDADGVERFHFGVRGSGPGNFRQLGDIALAPNGEILVGDRGGTRLQVFRREGESLRLLRALDLTEPKYTNRAPRPPGYPAAAPFFRRCSSGDIDVLDDETIIVFPCRIRDGEVTFLTGPQADGLLKGFFLPYVNHRDQVYYSLSIYSEDWLNPRAAIYPTIVRYADASFSRVAGYWPMAPYDPDTFRGPQRIDVHPAGPVYITDFGGLRRFEADGGGGRLMPIESHPGQAISITLQAATGDGTPDGLVGYGSCISNWRSDKARTEPCLGQFRARTGEWRGAERSYIEPLWYASAPDGADITRLEYDGLNDRVLLLDNAEQTLWAYDRAGRGRKQAWPLGGSDRSALFQDLAVSPEGLTYVLDVLRDQVQVRDAAGKILRTTRVPSDAWRIAAGAEGRLFLLTGFGEAVRLAPDGREEARWDVQINENAQSRNLTDLAVAADGRVFVTDLLSSQVSVFSTTGGEDPDVRAGQTCRVLGDKTASPGRVVLGEPVTVTLRLGGSCGAVETPSNVLLVVNTKDPDALDTARQIVSLADFGRHRLGLMGYYLNTAFRVRWTNDASKIISGLENLNAGGGSESSERNALSEALRELRLVPGRGVVVLIGAEYCIRAERPACAESQDAEPLAAELRAAGHRVVVVNSSTDAAILAGSDLDVLFLWPDDLRTAVAVYQRVSELLRPPQVLRQASVTDVIPPNMTLDAASLPPAATWDERTRTLSWSPVNIPAAGSTLSYRLLPQAAGRWATNLRAEADYLDGWEGRGVLTFPVPEVDVVPPPTAGATATPPATATIYPTTPPTATPSPTEAPRVLRPVFLPRLERYRCTPLRSPVELALLLDTSASMGQPLGPDGATRLALARGAARSLVGQLAPGDRVAVLAFDGRARTVLALGDDHVAAGAALDGLALGQGSRLDLGLAEATAALAARRPGAAAGLVLFSDGRASVDPALVHRAADAAWSAGVRVHAIATGADADAQLLMSLARDAARFHASPGGADLVGIVGDLRPAPYCAEGGR